MAAKRAFIFYSVLAIVAINVVSCSSDLNSILDNVLEDNFQTYGILNTNRGRREAEKSGIYMKKQKADLPVCHNMKGILGGQNAFNYVSLILAILTLIVNVNNNINNNNNNLNQFSGNVVGNNNANANTNNNNGNIVNVMPPGKKKKKRSLKKAGGLSNLAFANTTTINKGNIIENEMWSLKESLNNNKAESLTASCNSMLGNASIATLKILQVALDLENLEGEDACKAEMLCSTIKSVQQMGKIGQIIGKSLKMASSHLLSSREVSYAEVAKSLGNDKTSICHNMAVAGSKSCENMMDKLTKPDIRCSSCGHKIVPDTAVFLNMTSPHAISTINASFFGHESSIIVQEFVNPHNVHFHSFNVNNANIHENANEIWNSGNTWFPGYSWKVAYCEHCGQPIGWIWQKNNKEQTFHGIRLDRIIDLKNHLFGPLLHFPFFG